MKSLFKDLVHNWARCSKPQKRKQHTATLSGMESLEERTLLTAGAVLSSGVLTVTGTEGNDRIQINEADYDRDQVLIRVSTIDGTTLALAAYFKRDVDRIVVNALAGDDRVNQTTEIPELIYAGDGNDLIVGGGGSSTIYGGNGNDSLYGTSGHDRLDGENGNDYLHGGTNNDTLFGGNGNDQLYGSYGIDWLLGGANNDSLFGGSNNDRLYGQSGDDSLRGGSGDDSLSGGSGDDVLIGDIGNDKLWGLSGNDTLLGWHGNDSLFGGTGADDLRGGFGNDYLDGGHDFERDKLQGGGGTDVFVQHFNNYWIDLYWTRIFYRSAEDRIYDQASWDNDTVINRYY